MLVFLLLFRQFETFYNVKTFIFEVKTLILHPFNESKVSGGYLRPVDI